MKKMRKIGTLILSVLVAAIFVSATNPSTGFIIESVNTDNFPTIELRLSAWESSGTLLKSLKTSDFRINEEGGDPFEPASMKVDTDSPLAVALVLDVSGSMVGQALKDAQVAAARFLDRLGANDQAALVAFSDAVNPDPAQLKADKEYGFTRELKVIYDAVEGLQAEGGTELYNALQKAIALTAQLPEGHRAVLLLSDGMNDPASVGDPEAPITMAKEMNVPVFIIGLGYNTDEAYLTRLAAETGGFARFAPRSSELAQAFKDIAELLKTQYILTYESRLSEANREVTTNINLLAAGTTSEKSIVISGLDEKIEALEAANASQNTVSNESVEAVETTPDAEVLVQNLSTQYAPAVTPFQDLGLEPDPQPTLLELLKVPWVWLGLAALIAVFVFFVFRGRKDQTTYHCARCGYKLTDANATCPECGETRKM